MVVGSGAFVPGSVLVERAQRRRTWATTNAVSPTPQPSVCIADFDAPVPFLELAAFNGRQGALCVERQRPPRGLVFEGEVVVPKRHLWQWKAECGLERIALGRVGDGVGGGGDEPAMDVDRARVGRL